MPPLTELFSSFQSYGGLPALIDEGHTVSFAKLSALVDERTQKWRMQKVSHVVFEAATSLDCILDLLALWQLRLTACPFNPRLPSIARQALIKRMKKGEQLAATYLATSGTTATPKIAVHTLNNYLASAKASIQALQLGPGDRWHLSLPLFHVSGLSILFRCLLSGAAIVISQKPHTCNATHFSLVPTQLFRILKDQSNLAYYQRARCLLVGGAPLLPSLQNEAQNARLPLYTSWGMTETTAMAVLNGKILPHIEVSLSEDNEIRVRGPSLFQGYLEPQGLHNPFASEGWFYTRDLGALDENGRLLWKGRKDNLFISGGENIQPEEIEQALGQLPHVVEAIVIPVTDPEFGDRPAAFVRTNTIFDPDILRNRLADHLPKFKIPRWFFPFPDNDLLKPNRQQLRQLAFDLASRCQ